MGFFDTDWVGLSDVLISNAPADENSAQCLSQGAQIRPPEKISERPFLESWLDKNSEIAVHVRGRARALSDSQPQIHPLSCRPPRQKARWHWQSRHRGYRSDANPEP